MIPPKQKRLIGRIGLFTCNQRVLVCKDCKVYIIALYHRLSTLSRLSCGLPMKRCEGLLFLIFVLYAWLALYWLLSLCYFCSTSFMRGALSSIFERSWAILQYRRAHQGEVRRSCWELCSIVQSGGRGQTTNDFRIGIWLWRYSIVSPRPDNSDNLWDLRHSFAY